MKYFSKSKQLLCFTLLCSLSSLANAEINVDQSNGILKITSDIEGTVTAKVIGPDDTVIIDESFYGSSFSWSPLSSSDGAYRYDVSVVNAVENEEDSVSDYAGGSVEIKNGQISNTEVAK